MGKKKRTTKEFIEESAKIHNFKYDYSLTNYTTKDKKVIIICPIHKEFEQIAHSHIRGYGCKKCSFVGINSKTEKQFIEDAKKIHGNTYDYSKVKYINTHTKVILICSIHGEFFQTPHDHLIGCHCKKCSLQTTGNKLKLTKDEFINACNIIHKHKYDYSNIEYKTAFDKINIICKQHGVFSQAPYAHKNGQGCPECSNLIKKENAPSWTVTNWINAAKKSKTFDSFKIYIIRCFNEDEEFIKIGRTYNTVKKRFYMQLPYSYEILNVIVNDNGKFIYNLETELKKALRNFKYIPKIKFGGMYECFKINLKSVTAL